MNELDVDSDEQDPEEVEVPVTDDTEDESVPFRYSITSYGADYPVDTLVKRINDGVIWIPPFQRNFVWTMKDASRFIETLLLGLPVPGIFLSKVPEGTNKLLVIDGQQRLKSLQFFYNGIINGREFALRDVQERFLGKTYTTLLEEDRRGLDDAVIHATVIKQDKPDDGQSSIYHIFERLNTGGRALNPQEIRACLYFGKFNEYLAALNEDEDWRRIFGPKSRRLKDQELLLRFFALHFDNKQYARPMKEFLNEFMHSNRALNKYDAALLNSIFKPTIAVINDAFGKQAFRPEGSLNAAVFESVMVGLAEALTNGAQYTTEDVKQRYSRLMTEKDYLTACKLATADEKNVSDRLRLARQAFQPN